MCSERAPRVTLAALDTVKRRKDITAWPMSVRDAAGCAPHVYAPHESPEHTRKTVPLASATHIATSSTRPSQARVLPGAVDLSPVCACVRACVCLLCFYAATLPTTPAGTRGEASYFRLFSAAYRFCTKQSKAPVSVCDLSVDSFIRKD